mmetsp:Transcript_31171/g.55937  ORF Transcript_31171/g.55937 Transcript_31171/m.55937 type:complete len:246 (-) Transcript_31171:973-1710(-)
MWKPPGSAKGESTSSRTRSLLCFAWTSMCRASRDSVLDLRRSKMGVRFEVGEPSAFKVLASIDPRVTNFSPWSSSHWRRRMFPDRVRVKVGSGSLAGSIVLRSWASRSDTMRSEKLRFSRPDGILGLRSFEDANGSDARAGLEADFSVSTAIASSNSPTLWSLPRLSSLSERPLNPSFNQDTSLCVGVSSRTDAPLACPTEVSESAALLFESVTIGVSPSPSGTGGAEASTLSLAVTYFNASSAL